MRNLRKHLHRIACGSYLGYGLSSQCGGGAHPRLAGLRAGAQSDARIAEAVPVDHALKLDGTLDDPLWLTAQPISDFRQREPFEGRTPTEKTEVRILYTRHAVYFGIRCYDLQPSRIVATELRRDVSQDLDDHFEIPLQRSEEHTSELQSPDHLVCRLLL